MSVISSALCNNLFGIKTSSVKNVIQKAFGSMWRYPDCGAQACWPNYKPHLEHHKHRRRGKKPFEEGIMKQTRLRIADNSKIGMEATAMGRPPKVIHVYSARQGYSMIWTDD